MRTLLGRCLQKDPKKRLPHIGLARLEIDEGQADAEPFQGSAASIVPKGPFWKRVLPIGGVAVIAVAVGVAVGWYVSRQAPRPIVRFPIALSTEQASTGQGFRSIAISPDGSQIAYVSDGRLFRHSLSDLETHLIVSQDTRWGAVINPAFSPDSRSIAYVSAQDKTIRRIAVDGGTPVTVCSLDALPSGVSWDAGGILFEADGSIMRVSADGGTPETLIAKRTSDRLRNPHMLPDGRTVLFTLVARDFRRRWMRHRMTLIIRSGPGMAPSCSTSRDRIVSS